ncbi:PTS system sucrose-specific transporter subunit IIBC [Raoultella ornithinolytica]|nr:PTS system sucrose-specific transporter subunit IIBC [Raoultella ornithinolytica]
MDFEQISRSLLPLLGGKENIASAAHCATRLRLVLIDDAARRPAGYRQN